MTIAALTTDSDARKDIPLARGCLDYFPAALAEVARLSKEGNDKHNPGEPMHHARGKSGDHADCILRHLADRGTVDTDGFDHAVKVAWRALAMLQEILEQRGAPLARAARLPKPQPEPKKPLAWNEGWKCPGCGSTKLWPSHTREGVEEGLRWRTPFGPLCNSVDCDVRVRMVRDV
jgi:hypothetical protein